MRFVTWNLNVFTRDPGPKIRLLADAVWDVAALQEVDPGTVAAIVEADLADVVVSGLQVCGEDTGPRGHGSALLVRGVEVSEASIVADLPKPERGLVVKLESDLTVVSWHAPNAAGDSREVKMAGYQAMSRALAALESPVVVGMDTNSWHDPIALEPADPTGDWFEEHSFLGSEPEHGLVDALRKWLAEHPNEMERIGRLRPDGPLDLTYDHGKKSYPRPDRFDRILVSPGIEVGGYGSRYGDALAAGSDHALLWAELAIG